MHTYSAFFSTLHEEAAPVGNLGRGTHYSILRAVLWPYGTAMFHDFAVIWDEDHDDRIIWVAEQLCFRGLLGDVVALGERKGAITLLTPAHAQDEILLKLRAEMRTVTDNPPSDSFGLSVERFNEATGQIINDDVGRVRAYVAGIEALWGLGAKPCKFSTAPYGQPT